MLFWSAAVNKHASEKNHPARWVAGIFFVIYVCRGTETIPLFSALPLGDITVLLLVVTLVAGPKHLLVPIYETPLTKLVTTFGIFTVLSVAYSVAPVQSIKYVISGGLLTAILYVSMVKLIRSPRDLQFFSRLLIFGGALFTVSGVMFGNWDSRVRVQSAFDTNDLAMFLAIILPITLVERALTKSRLVSLSLGVLTIGMILLLILTSSRGGFLALTAVGSYLLLFPGFILGHKQASMRTKIGRLVLILVIVFALLMLAPPDARDRILGLTDLSEDYNLADSHGGRIAIWTRGLTYLGGHPWGGGVASFQWVDQVMGGYFKAPHNSFVQVFVETGVINGIVFLSLLIGSWRGLRRVAGSISRREYERVDDNDRIVYAYSHALIAALIGYVVAGFFLSHGYSPTLFALLALTGASIRLADQPRPKRTQEMLNR